MSDHAQDAPHTGELPPPQPIMDLITGKWLAQALYVAAKLGIADLLKDGPAPVDELARANQMDASALYRVLRALASVGVFHEVDDKQFALTPLAGWLRSDVPGSFRPTAIMCGEEWSWRSWGDLLRSVKTGEPAFDRLYGKDLFAYFAETPVQAAIFDDAMTGWSAQSAAAVVAAYDLSGIGTLVDVGGGHGLLLSAILKANPRMRGVLFDSPQVIEGAGTKIAAAGLSDRCQLVAGDFFESVPPADAAIMKHIIHDWSDEKSRVLLENCRRAVSQNGRVLIVEMVIPPGNTPHLGKLLDLEMLVMASGRERTESEYADLLQRAGLRLSRIVPTASSVSVIEAVAV